MLTSHGDFFQLRELHDSMAPDCAIFKGFAITMPGKDGPPKLEFAEEEAGMVVRAVQRDSGLCSRAS